MTWRDNLKQASFRKAKFFVSSSDYNIGRRNVVHQYPGKDIPYAQDLGLDADEFNIQGYVIANETNDLDYFDERNALIKALKDEGPGTLVHPYLGNQNVVLIGKANIRESFSTGGIATFSMTFKIAGENIFPKEDTDDLGAVDKAKGKVDDDAQDGFGAQAVIDGEPKFSVSGMVDDYNSFITSTKTVVNSIRNAGSAALTSIKSTMDDSKALLLEVVKLPCEIGNLVVDTMDSILGVANIVGSGYLGEVLGNCTGQVLRRKLSSTGDEINEELGVTMTQGLLDIAGNDSTNGFGAESNTNVGVADSLTEIDVTTPARARQASNRLAFVNTVKAMAISAAIAACIRINFSSYNASQQLQNDIIESIDYLLLKLGDESASDPYGDYGIYVDNRSLYNSIDNLKSAFVDAMKQTQLNLKQEINFSPSPNGATSLQLAYEQYNDLDRDDEIFTRNQPNIDNPGFINKDIKILVS